MDRAEAAGIEAVANADGEADVQAFASLDDEDFAGGFGPGRGGGCVDLLARVIENDGVNERGQKMRAGIQRSGVHAGKLAYANARVAVGNYRNAECQQYRQDSRQGESLCRLPTHRAERAIGFWRYSFRPSLAAGLFEQPAESCGNIDVIGDHGSRAAEQAQAENHQEEFQSEHGVVLSFLFLERLTSGTLQE